MKDNIVLHTLICRFNSIMRSKYGTYPEYHTSLDNFDLVTSDGLNQSLDIYMKVVKFIENNNYYPPIKVFVNLS